ncbi:NAD(+) synthetase [Mesomycoplasma hyopneumoniae]|uniref:NH(3)-dependent NAD(+) synthetase n=5 Tax=Mesomycoplasma hyopneumoniae TaxID=2099 RepID=Q9RGC4_MESHO|nr:NAD(+) synthase [Mesomycoplasma hyopneumoniae]AAF22217.1 NH(3)-dependent NAD+ synthetase [Mesomycoplasma hyopneumoniae]AAV27587.1 NH(3)-dependent NAD+ synthetase [Mesomycoplasma hyopneumoniae 232]AAZ53840.1 NH(3)-dependent NAD+ synthetase [Mesomycoplasma hyopneumoniae 7448]ADQ90679.1 NH(3)-dependent NAD+ synthetase [Mesomycoplasma hyopneumoniae 168]AGM22255.1 NH(3)-dependent NAD+ synthetase [Mesomycoplasma hyopneumoniae 168-L]
MINKQDLINYFNYLIEWIRQEVKKAQKKGVIFGLSGGVDSALVAVLANKAFPDSHLGLIMPIRDMITDMVDIDLLVKKFGIKNKEINLKPAFENLKKCFNLKNKLANSNIQPRLRMTSLYAFAQEFDYLVLGTDNFSEMYLGYFTKYGDGGVDLLPIVNLTKVQVWKMAAEIGIPESIIKKKPSANLWENQTDENEMGFSYGDLDLFMENPNLVSKEIAAKITKLHEISSHKRDQIPRPLKKLGEI